MANPFSTANHAPWPARTRHQEAAAALLRTSGLIEARFARVIKPAGITLQQYHVLRILRGEGENGLATLAIAAQMIDRSPGITRLVDRLERRGLVQRVRGSDRRQVLCHIAEKGLELLASLDAQVDAADETIFSALTHNEVAALVHLLNRVQMRLQ